MSDLFGRVDAPPLVVPRRGLLASAVTIDETGDDWTEGVSWLGESCDRAAALPLWCAPDPGTTKPVPDNPAPKPYKPFVVVGADECRTGPERDRVGRARRHLLGTESAAIEAELWDGAIAVAEGYPNEFLAAAAAADELDPAVAREAFAELDGATTECLNGQRGMIHATVATVNRWVGAGLVALEGGVLTSIASGNIVVAGSGYSGSAPGGAPPAEGTFAYGTGLVVVRRGPVREVGDATSQVNRSINRHTVYVERAAGAMWAGCCLIGVNVLPEDGGGL